MQKISPALRYMHRSLGEQSSPDVSGAPGATSSAVDNSGRSSPGSPGSKGSKLDWESGANSGKKTTPPASTAPTPAPFVPPAVISTPVVPEASMNGQAIIDALALVAEYQKNSKVIGTSPSVYIGGVGAAMDAVNWAKDLQTLKEAQAAIARFELGMKPGEVSHVLVSATPDGKVSVIRLPSPDADVVSDGKSSSYRTTISAPNFDRFRDIFKTDAQKKRELDEWFRSLDKETRELIEREGLKPVPPM